MVLKEHVCSPKAGFGHVCLELSSADHRMCGSAPCSSNTRTMSASFVQTASISAVLPHATK
eukprot:1666221-Amphidinium_carterae.1